MERAAPPPAAVALPANAVVAAVGAVWAALGAVPLALLFFAISLALLFAMQRVSSLEMPGAGATALAGVLLFSRAIVPEMMQRGLEGRPAGERLRGLVGLLAGVFFYAGALAPRLHAGSRWGALAVEVVFKVHLWLPRLGVDDPSAAVDAFMRALGVASLRAAAAAAHPWPPPAGEEAEARDGVPAAPEAEDSRPPASSAAATDTKLRRRDV
jgi:hypothetical protein